ncbi:hypothetical protein GEV33_008275 [Tenebrio molitor]|uniref:Uncharacterized protein n=1 Tax=Tenebrio molitor TaxID=7067 RepID=A0A8J6HGY1_TENMO|nr:hypothetical protein GEV33_008275 [Tenebrio molitor]
MQERALIRFSSICAVQDETPQEQMDVEHDTWAGTWSLFRRNNAGFSCPRRVDLCVTDPLDKWDKTHVTKLSNTYTLLRRLPTHQARRRPESSGDFPPRIKTQREYRESIKKNHARRESSPKTNPIGIRPRARSPATMEKDSGRYCYEPYQSKNSTNSLKRDAKTKKSNESCRCFGKSRKSRTKAFFTGLATNLGICILLFGYTLIGSVIFLAIEGGNTFQHSTTQILATTSMASDNNKKFLNHSAEFKARNDEARARTVENIWDITVSLNILYRDNWTRLAAQEITRFQDELLKSLGEELAQQPVQEKKTAGRVTGENYEWTFAKAFLYSLTVLTTIAISLEYFPQGNRHLYSSISLFNALLLS